MAQIQHNALLNSILVSLGHSLLQYASECWPWVGLSESETQSVIDHLASLQRQEVAAIAELLDRRECTVDFGGYPTDYTDLHFVALDFLLARIIAGEQSLVADLEEAVHTSVDDPQAAEVLHEVLTTQRKILERLHAVAAVRKQAAGAGA
jgi:hypothetical protein